MNNGHALKVVVCSTANQPTQEIINKISSVCDMSEDLAVQTARSILSVEIVKVLQNILVGTGMSPMSVSIHMLNNIPIAEIAKKKDPELLRSFLFNEFHKVCMEASMHTGKEFHQYLNPLMGDLMPICGNAIAITNTRNWG